ARIAERPQGGDRRSADWQTKPPIGGLVPPPPTQAEAAKLLSIGTSSIQRAREVAKHGTVPLQKLVEQGEVPVYTAARVAREFDPEQQDEFVQRVENGADPKKLAANLNVPSQWKPRESTARTDNRSSKRHQHITVNALRNLQSSLDALDLVLKNTDGLDPAITDEEAAQWLDGLSKGRGALNRVLRLLTDRKESNPLPSLHPRLRTWPSPSSPSIPRCSSASTRFEPTRSPRTTSPMPTARSTYPTAAPELNTSY